MHKLPFAITVTSLLVTILCVSGCQPAATNTAKSALYCDGFQTAVNMAAEQGMGAVSLSDCFPDSADELEWCKGFSDGAEAAKKIIQINQPFTFDDLPDVADQPDAFTAEGAEDTEN